DRVSQAGRRRGALCRDARRAQAAADRWGGAISNTPCPRLLQTHLRPTSYQTCQGATPVFTPSPHCCHNRDTDHGAKPKGLALVFARLGGGAHARERPWENQPSTVPKGERRPPRGGPSWHRSRTT